MTAPWNTGHFDHPPAPPMPALFGSPEAAFKVFMTWIMRFLHGRRTYVEVVVWWVEPGLEP